MELISGKTIVKKRVLQLTGGFGWGDIALPDTLSAGDYRIRAYTQWMRNWPGEFFFDKAIKIGNLLPDGMATNAVYGYRENTLSSADIDFTDKKGAPFIQIPVSYTISFGGKRSEVLKGTTDIGGKLHIDLGVEELKGAEKGYIGISATMADKKTVSRTFAFETRKDNIDLQFFPEGGHMITGIPCRVAYKAVAPTGLGVDVKGSVTDQDGAVVADFSDSYLGMGSFYFTPQNGVKYSAKIVAPTGRETVFALPKPLDSGYGLMIAQKDSNEIAIKAMLSEDLAGRGTLHMVAQHNGEIFKDIVIPEPSRVNRVKLKTDSLPVGTVLFTLFGADGLPACERLAFVNKRPNQIELDAEKLDSVFAPRQKMDINLLATKDGKPVQGSFSVSVTNASIVVPDEATEGNILAGLLLASELSGHVEKPNSYFARRDSASRARLDNLLLTQGWRKIDWQKLDTAQRLPFPPEKKLQITGSVLRSGKPIANGKVMLVATGKDFNVSQTTTNDQGKFIFEPEFVDTVGFAVKAVTEKGQREVSIKIDKPAELLVGSFKDSIEWGIEAEKLFAYYQKNVDGQRDELVKRGLFKGVNTLREVEVKSRKKYELPADIKGAVLQMNKLQTIGQAELKV